MRKSLKAQVTLFMILGIVIVSSFAFVYYLSNYFTKQQLEKKVDKIYGEIIQNTPIKLYVSKCVDRSLNDGLDLIGEGGGVIFSNVTGSAIPYISGMKDPENVLVDGHNVTLVIKDLMPVNTPHDQLPYYPCRNPMYAPCSGGELNDATNPCYFISDRGKQNQYCVPLTGNSLSDIDNPSVSKAYGEEKFFALEETSKKELRPTIAEQIETYVSNNTFSCVNFTGIAILTGQNITSGYPTSNATIGSDDVNVVVNFPVVITIEGKPPITRMVEFRASRNVRLKEIRDAVSKWTTWDNTNLSVNLLNELITELSNNYDVTEVRGSDYDVFTIKDLLYVTNNNPSYIFQFARQNRWPVLDYVTQDISTYLGNLLEGGKAAYTYPNESYGYDYVVPVGIPITITPIAHDPDEDGLTFNYTGWKQDYLEYWNFTKELELKETLGNCSWYPVNCTYKNWSVSPKNWTNSNPDYWKGGYAGVVSINTTVDEIGPHIVRVNVSDGVYSDYQDVKILVYDVPRINAAGRNYFGGLNASAEDPYYLDTRGTASICSNRVYDWQDASEVTTVPSDSRIRSWITNHTIYSGEANYVGLLNEYPTTDASTFDINNVTGAFSNYSGEYYNTQKSYWHDIILTVQNIDCPGIYTTTLPVNVAQCLPHEGSAAPYPYNSINVTTVFSGTTVFNSIPNGYDIEPDVFLANHTCCVAGSSGDYEVAGSGTECYHFESYGFKPNSSKEYYPANESRKDIDGVIGDPNVTTVLPQVFSKDIYNILTAVPWNEINVMTLSSVSVYDNDIYYRVLGQECGGRGNACTGDVSDKWITDNSLSCSDKNIANGEVETCSGPPIPTPANNYCRFGFDQYGKPCGQSNTPPICQPYGYEQSFEKSYLGLTGATGVCNPNWRLSNGEHGLYNTATGTYLCQGTCGFGGFGACNQAINCKKIDDYDLHIPVDDNPINKVPPLILTPFQMKNTVYGVIDNNGWASSNTPSTYQSVFPPSNPDTKYWCDGICFSYSIPGDSSSPTTYINVLTENFCTARNYFGVKKVGNSFYPGAMQDGINFTYINLDDSATACNGCGSGSSNVNQRTSWISGGATFLGTVSGVAGCCGDDNSEYNKSCTTSGYNPAGCDATQICCQDPTNCINLTKKCVVTGTYSKFNYETSYCNNGEWKDLDTDQTLCTNVFGSDNWDGAGKCCGDDGNNDDWAFADGAYLCFDGVKTECTGTVGVVCSHKSIPSGIYYCNGAQWTKDNSAGKACGHPDALHNLVQEGLCAHKGGSYICDSVAPIVNPYGTFYVTDCTNSYVSKSCDNTPTPSDFFQEGNCFLNNNCGKCGSGKKDINDKCEKGCGDIDTACQGNETGIPFLNNGVYKLCDDECTLCTAPAYVVDGSEFECGCEGHLTESCVNNYNSPGNCFLNNECRQCFGKKDSDDKCESGCGSSNDCQGQESEVLFGSSPNIKLCTGECNLCPVDEAYVVDGTKWLCGCNGNTGMSCDEDHDGAANGYCSTDNKCEDDYIP